MSKDFKIQFMAFFFKEPARVIYNQSAWTNSKPYESSLPFPLSEMFGHLENANPMLKVQQFEKQKMGKY